MEAAQVPPNPDGAEARAPDELVDRGLVHVVDLVAVRVSSGVLWERTQASVFERLKSVLRAFAPEATFEITGPDRTRCVITMNGLGAEEASVLCVKVAHDVIFGLLGRCELSDIHVSRAQIDIGNGQLQHRLQGEELMAVAARANLPGIVLPKKFRAKLTQAGPRDMTGSGSGALALAQRDIKTSFGFEPVWDARNEVICMYVSAPREITCEAEQNVLLNLRELTAKERTALEQDAFSVGAEHLSRFVERGDRFLLNVMISFETLSSPSGRAEITRICRGVLPAYRQYLVFTLIDVPLGVSSTRLSEFVMLLRPFARVIATIAHGGRNYSAYQNIGLAAIALDLSIREKDMSSVQGDILHIAAAARSFKLGAALYGIRTGDTAGIAHAADIRLFHGPAVGDAKELPRRMSHKTRDAIVPEAKNAGEEDWF